MNVTFKLNGQSKTVDVPAEMPLLWVLRDVLDMKGTKFGCGSGHCGACTVHINGTATRSCQRAMSRVQGVEVTTIEGLSPDGSHPLQKAWKELDVPQCGYCQAGQLMAAAALLKRNPKPSADDIDTAMTNICRCATYERIRAGIQMAAGMTPTPVGSGTRNGQED
jgi:isoquinoline 1-oxidoreductase subunit alpha